MIKTLASIAIALAALGAGGYFIYTRTTVVQTATPVTPAPNESQREPDSRAAPRPDHGNFNQRFEPKPPAPNGGKAN